MNQLNVAIFKLIAASAKTFKNRMNDALLEYRSEMTKAREYAAKFKDEKSVLRSQKSLLVATAQEKIRKAQRMFASDLDRYTEQLESQLQQHVSEPLDAGFRDQLLTIAQFGLKPSRTQIAALLKANNGNAIGVAALSKTLSDVGSRYTVNHRSVEDYEADLATIRRLMVAPVAYDIDDRRDESSINVHHEALEVMSGLEQVFVRDDGTTYTRGFHWDGPSLLIARAAFDAAVEEIEQMQQSWIADVSCQTVEEENDADALMDELLESVGADSEQTEEIESSTVIVDGDGEALQIAREMGQQRARENMPMDEATKAAYVR